MEGSAKVVAALNELLRGELAARDQYFIHSRRYAHLGFPQLFSRINHEMQEETGHADDIMRRVLMLDGEPDMRTKSFVAGLTVEDMLTKDLALELEVRENLKQAIALCEVESDFVSRDMLRAQLDDTEQDHAYWLEQQLRLIKLIGLENYQQSKMTA